MNWRRFRPRQSRGQSQRLLSFHPDHFPPSTILKRHLPSGAGLLLCILLTAGLYLPTVSLPFMSQDFVELEVASAPLAQFVTGGAYGIRGTPDYYRPGWRAMQKSLLAMSGGAPHPAVYHGVQLALHLLCVALLFLWILQQTRSAAGATAGALLLGVHPSIVGAVAWCSANWTVASGALFLAVCLLADPLARAKGRFTRVAVSLLCGALLLCLALVSETGAAAALTAGAWLVWRCCRVRGVVQGLAMAAPALAGGACYLALRFVALGNAFGETPYSSPEDALAYGKLRMLAWGIGYDLTLLMNPLRVPAFELTIGSHAVWPLALGMLAAFAAAAWLAVRYRLAGEAALLPCSALPPLLSAEQIPLAHPKPPIGGGGGAYALT